MKKRLLTLGCVILTCICSFAQQANGNNENDAETVLCMLNEGDNLWIGTKGVKGIAFRLLRIVIDFNGLTGLGTAVIQIHVKLAFIRNVVHRVSKENVVGKHGVGFTDVKPHRLLHHDWYRGHG